MHTIKTHKHTYYLPASIDQFTKKQFIILCELLHKLDHGAINFVQFKFLLAVRLLGIKKRSIKTEEQREVIMNISNVFDSLFTENSNQFRLNTYMETNLVQTVWGLFRKYHGPYDGFSNITFGEFVKGLDKFYHCTTEASIENLSALLAVFYRKKKFKYWFRSTRKLRENGIDVRSDKTISIRARKYISPGALFGFFFYFRSFHEQLSNSVMIVEGSEIDLSILFNDNQPASNTLKSNIPGLGMLGIAFHIANQGGLGDLENVNRRPMWEVLLYLYNLKKAELDEAKAQEKSNSNEKK